MERGGERRRGREGKKGIYIYIYKKKQMAVLNYESFQLNIKSEHKEKGYKINSCKLFPREP